MLVLVLLGIIGAHAQPWTMLGTGKAWGATPDTQDYTYGALAIIRGTYVVDWDGLSHVSRYPPGFPLLLAPAVALGGFDAASWVPALAGLVVCASAAALAWRLSGVAFAAPLGAWLAAFAPAPFIYTRLVLSDLPSAALTLIESVCLVSSGSPRAAVQAGLIGGALVAVRPASTVLLLSAVVALGATRYERRLAWLYAAGALPPLIGLALWQLWWYGSPLTTGYQALGFFPDAGMFSANYLFGLPDSLDGGGLEGAARSWAIPNVPLYVLELLGGDNFIVFTGVGLIGVLGALRMFSEPGPRGVFGRFTLLSVCGLLAVYGPYFYQAPRFLMPGGVLLSVAASVGLAEAWRMLGSTFWNPHPASELRAKR